MLLESLADHAFIIGLVLMGAAAIALAFELLQSQRSDASTTASARSPRWVEKNGLIRGPFQRDQSRDHAGGRGVR